MPQKDKDILKLFFFIIWHFVITANDGISIIRNQGWGWKETSYDSLKIIFERFNQCL